MSSKDDANKTIAMIKLIGPWASVFLLGTICGWFACKLLG